MLPLLRLALIAVQAAAAPPGEDLVRLVDPFLGTDASDSPDPVPGGAGGSTFPGATAPFGMVQWSPDTPKASPSGYRYSDAVIEGFSLTHFNGAGCPNNEDLPVLPVVGAPVVSPGKDWARYAAPFTHERESASPGRYAVTLGTGVAVELAATTRTGFGRFAFPATDAATLLFDVGHHATGAKPGSVRIVGGDRVAGYVTGGHFCRSGGTFRVFFAARFDRPFTAHGTWDGDKLSPGAREVSGPAAGAWLSFDARTQPAVQMKIGLSYVSQANAEANLDAESPGWDLQAVAAATAAAWNRLLGRLRVQGGSDSDRRQLYTALYHVFSNPSVASDVNGEYRGFDDAVHRSDRVTYQNISGWDVYRSWIQLMAVLAPGETADLLRSMTEAGQVMGHLPKWTHAHREANVMNGDPGTLIVANAWAFGARDFDARAALAVMNRSGSEPSGGVRSGVASFLRLGFLPGAPATMLEQTSADFAISRMARDLGDEPLALSYARRAATWRNTFNPETRYVQPRNADGGWRMLFDPTANGNGFVEGNAAQYTFMVPYDMGGLVAALGGPSTTIARLDDLFSELNAGMNRPHFYIGNEPQFATPWAYHFAGAPWKTQQVVRRIVRASFREGPGGLPGNDDLGATSSWYVWAALGLYPAIPGTDVLLAHGPLFPQVTLTRGDARAIVIRGAGAGDDAPYVQALAVNGRPSARAWLRFADLAGGGTLAFTMGRAPQKRWGARAAEAPPSFHDIDRVLDLARGRPATGSEPCDPQHGAEKAVDGSLLASTNAWCSAAPQPWLAVDLGARRWLGGFLLQHAGIHGSSTSNKWCSHGAKWLQVDLGATATLTRLVLRHAGSGGESRAWNTRDFKLLVSEDARVFREVVTVTGNTDDVTTHALPPTAARFVRLEVQVPTSTPDTGARIYELEAYDAQGVNLAHGRPAIADGACNANEGPEKAVDGGEEPAENTRDFSISVGDDGRTWTKVVEVAGNTASQTSHPIAPTLARWVRVDVSRSGPAPARLYELEVAPAARRAREAKRLLDSPSTAASHAQALQEVLHAPRRPSAP